MTEVHFKWSTFLGVVALGLFAFAGNVSAQQSECVAYATPKLVTSGGEVSHASEALSADGVAASIGNASGDAGWIILDLGCFTDHVGLDLAVTEVGVAEGGEVYVGSANASTRLSPNSAGVPDRSGWTRIPEDVPPHELRIEVQCDDDAIDATQCHYRGDLPPFVCDGRETLPESTISDECGAYSPGLMEMSIGNDDNRSYKYVYIWSDGAATDLSEYDEDGASDIDGVAVLPPDASLELSARGSAGGTLTPIQVSTEVGSPVSYRVAIERDAGSSFNYDFWCNYEDGKDATRSGSVVSVEEGYWVLTGLSCQFDQPGNYESKVVFTDGSAMYESYVTITALGDGTELVFSADGGAASARFNHFSRMFMLIIGVGALGFIYLLIATDALSALHHKRENMSNEGESTPQDNLYG